MRIVSDFYAYSTLEISMCFWLHSKILYCILWNVSYLLEMNMELGTWFDVISYNKMKIRVERSSLSVTIEMKEKYQHFDGIRLNVQLSMPWQFYVYYNSIFDDLVNFMSLSD